MASTFGGTPGIAPLNYLQVYAPDIQYAEMNVSAPAQVVEGGGVTVSTTAQALLNLASTKLFTISEPSPSIMPSALLDGETRFFPQSMQSNDPYLGAPYQRILKNLITASCFLAIQKSP